MRPRHSNLTSAVVTHALCELVISHLALTDYKRCLPASLLARLLLLASVLGRSLSFVAQRAQDAPSDETLRKAVLFNLPGPDLLRARLLAALHALLPDHLRHRPLPAAVDYHQRPFYGNANTPGIRGGKFSAGAHYFWTFATLCLIVRGQRYTVGLSAVPAGQTQDQVVARLLAQAAQAGVRLRYLLMDRAFHDAAVLATLQERGLPFVVPMTCRGDENRATGTAAFFRRGQVSGRTTHTWSARVTRWDEGKQKEVRGRGVTVTVAVCIVARQDKRRPLVFATWGLGWSPYLVRQRYRRRFGIETSYRQLGEVLGATTSKDERVRLLLLGLALLVRQYWCLVNDSRGSGGRRATLCLVELRTWLLIELTRAVHFRLELLPDDSTEPRLTAA